MQITRLDHVALHVKDLEITVRFYRNVLGLEPIPRPDFNFPGAWFRIGSDQELHIIARPPKEGAYTPPRERHFALKVDDIEAFSEHLQKLSIDHSGPNLRPDGARQIFLRDPDEHVIELCSTPAVAV